MVFANPVQCIADRAGDTGAGALGAGAGRALPAPQPEGVRQLFDEVVALDPGPLDALGVAQAGRFVQVLVDRVSTVNRLARGSVGREAIAASRPFVEAHVRQRVHADPAVSIRDGCEVRGLVASPDRRRVVGVRVVPRADDGPEETLSADLVVDCSGRRSPVPG